MIIAVTDRNTLPLVRNGIDCQRKSEITSMTVSNTTNELRAPLREKRDIEDVSSELDNGGCTTYWMKCPEFYCSRRVRHLIKSVQDV
ncbi:hypothetical protein TNCV_4367511 [Trichonephila clavipes]|nr:hypothetical protein TNCV_4367511 [Trichonephila clavipes]